MTLPLHMNDPRAVIEADRNHVWHHLSQHAAYLRSEIDPRIILVEIDDPSLEVLLTLGLAFGGYELAVYLHFSAPIMAVCAGLLIGDVGTKHGMSAETRDYVDAFWKLIDEILNAVLFLLIGFEVFAVAFEADYLLSAVLAIGLALLTLFPLEAPEGAAGWVHRGYVTPDLATWAVIIAQAVGSILGVLLLTRGYQLGEASYVSINEYSMIVFASLFAWLMWGQALGAVALIGIAFIILSGSIIALRSK